MFKRSLLWLTLLLAGLAAYRAFAQKILKSPPQVSPALLDFVKDPVVVCDSAGAVTYSNTAAQELFGRECAGLSGLRYPNGQAIPPGQRPLSRVLRSGKSAEGRGYLWTAPDGMTRILDVSAYPLSEGGAAAVCCDVTSLHASQTQETQTQARAEALYTLGRRLNSTPSLEAIGHAVVEETHSLLGSLPQAQVRLYRYTPAVQSLTRLASEPEDRPKRPQTSVQASVPQFPFDATVPALWQIYIARQSSAERLDVLGEAAAASALALPLLSGGTAIGHLSVTSSRGDAFDDPALRATLESIADLAALALAGPQSALLAGTYREQAEAVREIAQAAANGMERSRLADLITGHVKRMTGAEVCTLSVVVNATLSLAGEAFQDDLLLPGQLLPDAPALHGKPVQKAWRTQKTVTHLGMSNPSFEVGPWRAFAGRAGQHSVTAVPLTAGLGVLAVYMDGSTPLTDGQIKFMEIAAALASTRFGAATI